jgi:hypothetical protein
LQIRRNNADSAAHHTKSSPCRKKNGKGCFSVKIYTPSPGKSHRPQEGGAEAFQRKEQYTADTQNQQRHIQALGSGEMPAI